MSDTDDTLRTVRRHLSEAIDAIDGRLRPPGDWEAWGLTQRSGRVSYLALIEAAFRQTALVIEQRIHEAIAAGASLDEMRIINNTEDHSQELWVGDRKSLRVVVN